MSDRSSWCNIGLWTKLIVFICWEIWKECICLKIKIISKYIGSFRTIIECHRHCQYGRNHQLFSKANTITEIRTKIMLVFRKRKRSMISKWRVILLSKIMIVLIFKWKWWKWRTNLFRKKLVLVIGRSNRVRLKVGIKWCWKR